MRIAGCCDFNALRGPPVPSRVLTMPSSQFPMMRQGSGLWRLARIDVASLQMLTSPLARLSTVPAVPALI